MGEPRKATASQKQTRSILDEVSMKLDKSYWGSKKAKSIHTGTILIVTLLDTKQFLELGSTNTQHAGEEILYPLSYIISDPCYFTPQELEEQYEDVTMDYLLWREGLYNSLEQAKEALATLKKYWSYDGSSMLNEISKKLARRVL